MTDLPSGKDKTPSEHQRWLVFIGVLKLLKGGFFIALGFGLLRLLHHDVYIFALEAIQTLHLDPDRMFVEKLLQKVLLLDLHRMKELIALVFIYAALDFVEGTGLVLEKRWAEYFTLVLTVALLPLEIIKLIYHPNHWTALVLLANVVIVIYLAWLVRPHRMRSATTIEFP